MGERVKKKKKKKGRNEKDKAGGKKGEEVKEKREEVNRLLTLRQRVPHAYNSLEAFLGNGNSIILFDFHKQWHTLIELN